MVMPDSSWVKNAFEYWCRAVVSLRSEKRTENPARTDLSDEAGVGDYGHGELAGCGIRRLAVKGKRHRVHSCAADKEVGVGRGVQPGQQTVEIDQPHFGFFCLQHATAGEALAKLLQQPRRRRKKQHKHRLPAGVGPGAGRRAQREGYLRPKR